MFTFQNQKSHQVPKMYFTWKLHFSLYPSKSSAFLIAVIPRNPSCTQNSQSSQKKKKQKKMAGKRKKRENLKLVKVSLYIRRHRFRVYTPPSPPMKNSELRSIIFFLRIIFIRPIKSTALGPFQTKKKIVLNHS